MGAKIDIIDMEESYADLYCSCLEDWSEEMKEAGDYKKNWLAKKKGEGLRVKLARDGEGSILGMIHYAPAERAPVVGKELYYVYCVWVHGYKAGVGNRQGKGLGKMLLEAAERDARELGSKGLVAWGITLPFFMRSKWFKRQGYRSVDRDGMLELVWKPFSEDAIPPKLYKPRKKPAGKAGIVTLTCLRNGWCPAQNLSVERAKRVAGEFPGKVDYVEIDTEDRAKLEEWGMADAIFVDDKAVRTGPPPSYAKLKKIVARKVKAL